MLPPLPPQKKNFNHTQDRHDLGMKSCIKNFDAFVTCPLMGNQPWPQFQNRIRERSIALTCNAGRLLRVKRYRCL